MVATRFVGRGVVLLLFLSAWLLFLWQRQVNPLANGDGTFGVLPPATPPRAVSTPISTARPLQPSTAQPSGQTAPYVSTKPVSKSTTLALLLPASKPQRPPSSPPTTAKKPELLPAGVTLRPFPRTLAASYRDFGPYRQKHGHFAGIVDTQHKIVLCTIAKSACTVWRKFMRRLAGHADWDTTDERITHNYGGKSSGLRYLSDLNEGEVDAIMADPAYFRGVVVRNPLTRALSAWKDKFALDGPHVKFWGHTPWDQFVSQKLGSGCDKDEHWVLQSCYCGMRKYAYEHVAHMDALETAPNSMRNMVQKMVASGHIASSFVDSGWGKDGQEAFLQTNTVFHATGASNNAKVAKAYSPRNNPGVLEKVLPLFAEDIVRFGYEADVDGMVAEILAAPDE